MRILFVSDTYFPHINGVYYFVCRIGPILQERGYEVAVMAPSETTHATLKIVDGIDVYGIPSMPIYIYPQIRIPIPWMVTNHASRIIKIFNPDIIHIQDHFSLSKVVLGIARKYRIPVIGTNHFMPENITVLFKNTKGKELLTRVMWKEFSKVFNQTELITTPTETGALLIRPHLKVPVKAISSGVDLSNFNPLVEVRSLKKKYSIPEKQVLLYVGRLDPEKHLEELLEAFANVSKNLNIFFVIVGKGIRKQALIQQAKTLGIEDEVMFTGFVPEEELPLFYKLSRCFAIASIAELLSLSTLQAMASGLPIIAAKAGALTELVVEGENGYMFEPGDIPIIEQSLYRVFNASEELYGRMRKKSLDLIKNHDIQRTTDQFEELYHQYYIPSPKSSSQVYEDQI